MHTPSTTQAHATQTHIHLELTADPGHEAANKLYNFKEKTNPKIKELKEIKKELEKKIVHECE